MLICCTTTTFLTVLSMSAIATNGKIRQGGVYYLVSRSLGPSTGGAIGILYYFASAFSTSMNILGAVETFVLVSGVKLGPSGFSERFFAFVVLILLVVCNFFSARIIRKTGFLIILFVFVSLFVMLIGLFASKARSAELIKSVPGLTGLSGKNFKSNFWSDYKNM